jgi:hypothetical protein
VFTRSANAHSTEQFAGAVLKNKGELALTPCSRKKHALIEHNVSQSVNVYFGGTKTAEWAKLAHSSIYGSVAEANQLPDSELEL